MMYKGSSSPFKRAEMINGKRVAVVMPAYNAESTLEATVREIPELVDIRILVDDYSKDKTVEVARRLGLMVFEHDRNLGYGGNQQTCYREALAAGADVVVMVHPDYQYTPLLITALASMVAYDVYDVVLGSRIIGGQALRGGMPLYKYIANRFLTAFENLFLRIKLSEYHTGWRAEIEAHGRPSDGPTFHYVSRRALPKAFRSGQRSVYAEYLVWQRGCLETAVELDAEHDFDVAHHLNWGSLFWGSTLSRLGKPFVFGPIGGGQTSPEVLREWFGESWHLEAQRNWALRVALRFNPRARRTIRRADLVLATNSETAARSRALGATRVELCLDTAVVPEAIAHEERRLPGRSAPTVLWVGRNLPRKGVALALHAFARVRRSVPSARLMMLGGGLDDPATTAQIEALGLVGAVSR